MYDLHEIGNRLWHFRKRTGMTQAEVAEAGDLSDRTYADIERGTVNMRLNTLLRICDVLHITPDEVLMPPVEERSAQLDQLLERLNACTQKDQQTALLILDVFLQSCEKKAQ